jgi:hypothetical protein
MRRSLLWCVIAFASWLFLPELVVAGGNPIDPLGLFGHRSAAATPLATSTPKAATPPLAKFQALGRVSSTLSMGPCANGPLSTCADCLQVQVSGPLNLTPGGKGTLSACITVDPTNVTNPVCEADAQGNGTITLANNDTITFALGGQFCIADAIPPTSPTTEIFVSNGGYTIEGGTGKQSTAVGSGDYSLPLTFTGSLPVTSAGEFNMTGNYAKQ